MRWIKAPEELKERIEKLVESIDCERRPMFGYPAYFINTHLFAGLFQDKLFVRLSPSQLSALKKDFPTIANLEPMPGRPMKDYMVLPARLYEDGGRMKSVLEEASTWCRTLPPKAAKGKKGSGKPPSAAKKTGKPAAKTRQRP